MSNPERFDFAFAPAYRLPARAFGIGPATALVEVSESMLDARFGRVAGADAAGERRQHRDHRSVRVLEDGRTRTPRDHRPWADVRDERDRGVLISFRAPVHGLDPLGVFRHPELTVTVAEFDRLAELLGTRMAT